MDPLSQTKAVSPARSIDPPPLSDSLRKATADLTKQAKIEVAREAILLQQMKALADDEVADVRALKRKHLGEHFGDNGRGRGDDLGDFIVCDDYIRGSPTSQAAGMSRWLVVLLAVLGLLGGTGIGAAVVAMLSRPAAASISPTMPTMQPMEYEVRFWTEDGQIRKEIRPVQPGDK